MNLRLTSLLLALSLAPLAAQTDRPSVPARINYQGFVTDNAGLPLGNATPTNFDIQFRLYTAGTGGTLLWAEQQSVTVAAGQFSVLLGNGVAINQSTPRPDLDVLFGPGGTAAAVGEVFLGLTVNVTGQTTALELTPRQQLVATPFSLRARHADIAQTVVAGGVPAAALVDGAANSRSIADGSVAAVDIAPGAVGSTQLAAGSVAAVALADGAVTEAKLAGGAVTAVKLGSGAVITDKLANGAVTGPKLAVGSVDASRIADGSITAADLGNGAVTPERTSFAQTNLDTLTLFPTAGPAAGTRLVLANQTATFSADGTDDYPFRYVDRQRNLTFGMGYSDDLFLEMRRNIGDAGAARLNSLGGWHATSDARLKKDIKPATGFLPKVLRLTPVTYRMRSGDDGEQLGFTAQDVEKEFPSLVLKGSDSWALNYAGLGSVAIGALIEEHAIVVKLEKRLAALEEENASLAARLDRLEKALKSTAAR